MLDRLTRPFENFYRNHRVHKYEKELSKTYAAISECVVWANVQHYQMLFLFGGDLASRYAMRTVSISKELESLGSNPKETLRKAAKKLDERGLPVMFIKDCFEKNDIDFEPKHKPSDFRHPCDGDLRPVTI